MIYLATPYSHPNPIARERRYLQAEALFQHFQKAGGGPYFSPIVHCHIAATRWHLPTDAVFWEKFNYGMLRHATELWLCELNGWQDSAGMKQEERFATAAGIPILNLGDAQEIVTRYGLADIE